MSEDKKIEEGLDLEEIENKDEGDWELTDDLVVVSSEVNNIEEFGEKIEETVKDEEEEKLIEVPEFTGTDEEIFNNMAAVLEGLLFLCGDDGLTIEQAKDTLGTDDEKTAELFDHLQKYYLDDNRGIEIVRFGKSYKFLSKAIVHDYAKRLFQINTHAKLSTAALETLAIIAYKQPITRVEIEEIRGVGADVMLRKLEARGLIKEDGRSDAVGRPILYSVTDEFMDAFQLISLDELPELPKFNTDEEGDGNLFQ